MAADQGGPQLSELESLQLKANQVTDESLESTRRMISLCEESQSAGIRTIEQLEQQGEQLERVESNMDKINAEMKEANKHITGMEKWCGLCVCPWNRAAKVRDVDASWKKPSKNSSGDKERIIGNEPNSRNEMPDSSNRGPYIQRIQNDAREDEMEDNMQAVGSILGNLKNMASSMGDEIGRQNNQIDRINAKGENVDLKIGSANKRTEKLLGK